MTLGLAARAFTGAAAAKLSAMNGAKLALVIALAGAAPATAVAQAGPPQCGDFIRLRDDTKQKAEAVREAAKKKAERKVVCGLVQRFYAAEAAVVTFLEKNKTWCNIPAEAVKNAKLGHEQTAKFRDMACNEAAAPKPHVPTLSEAIAQPSIDTGANTKTGQGTLDSLSGTPLAK